MTASLAHPSAHASAAAQTPSASAALPDNAIELRGLTKVYAANSSGKAVTALDHLDMVVPPQWRGQVDDDQYSVRDRGQDQRCCPHLVA